MKKNDTMDIILCRKILFTEDDLVDPNAREIHFKEEAEPTLGEHYGAWVPHDIYKLIYHRGYWHGAGDQCRADAEAVEKFFKRKKIIRKFKDQFDALWISDWLSEIFDDLFDAPPEFIQPRRSFRLSVKLGIISTRRIKHKTYVWVPFRDKDGTEMDTQIEILPSKKEGGGALNTNPSENEDVKNTSF